MNWLWQWQENFHYPNYVGKMYRLQTLLHISNSDHDYNRWFYKYYIIHTQAHTHKRAQTHTYIQYIYVYTCVCVYTIFTVWSKPRGLPTKSIVSLLALLSLPPLTPQWWSSIYSAIPHKKGVKQQPIEWGHCHSSIPYHAVLNSLMFYSLVFKWPLPSSGKQEGMTMNTCV